MNLDATDGDEVEAHYVKSLAATNVMDVDDCHVNGVGVIFYGFMVGVVPMLRV